MTDETAVRAACHGTPPLSARLEPWMLELLDDPAACSELLEHFGSPLNLHDFAALPRNARELSAVAETHGIDLRIFVARKANKTLGLVRAAHRAGLGMDVGSERELRQVLDAGVPARDVVATAAIKPAPLLRLGLCSRSLLVLDNVDELAAARRVADELAADAHDRAGSGCVEPFQVALRLAPRPSDLIPATRFGESAGAWLRLIDSGALGELLTVQGVHFHLHGYDPAARAIALTEAVDLIDGLRERGLARNDAFVDIGGGVPMSYLDSAEEWESFWRAHDSSTAAPAPPRPQPSTPQSSAEPQPSPVWRAEPLKQVYPYHQRTTRGRWLEALLDQEIRPGTTAGRALRDRGLQLRCEPGRSMLDGCGVTLARVIQRTSTSDGMALVGLEMNRTQCRSTSDDFLVDPLLIPAGGEPSGPLEGFLVGAYCIEAELLLRRRLAFPRGVAVGDVIALPNTAGYMMHILESASHQIPLASNIERVSTGARGPGEVRGFTRDEIDRVPPTRPWSTSG